MTSSELMVKAKYEIEHLDVTRFKYATGINSFMSGMFKNWDRKETVDLDLRGWDVSNFEDLSELFILREEINTIDVTGWKTTKCKDMHEMFSFCVNLTKIIGLNTLDTSNVEYMNNMFAHDYKLEEIDVSNFNTRNLKSAAKMFYSTQKLKRIDLSSFKLSSVRMDAMFYYSGVSEIIGLKVSGFSSLSGLFAYCSNLKIIDVSGFDMSDIGDISNMFSYCVNLKEVKGFSSLNASEIRDMCGTFEGCRSIEEIDISGWVGHSSPKGIDMRFTFADCNNLKEVKGLPFLDDMLDIQALEQSLQRQQSAFWKSLNVDYFSYILPFAVG